MKIINETRYETAPLRELARRVAAEELDSAKASRMVVRFSETVRGITRNAALGYCWQIGAERVSIFLPANPAKLDIEKVAHVIAHEFAHARGLRHPDMRNNPRYSWVRTNTADGTVVQVWREVVRQRGYVSGLAIVVRPPKRKEPKVDEVKLELALVRMQAWERKRKRAETGIKAWRRRVRYYERKIAAKTA
ncbi:MAG: hypothetical protein ACRD1P_07350, partial [Thermoanaerobaculia bacterium]